MKIIFLGISGVLNSLPFDAHRRTEKGRERRTRIIKRFSDRNIGIAINLLDEKAVSVLQEAVIKHDYKIVLSCMWKDYYTEHGEDFIYTVFAGTGYPLPPNTILGITKRNGTLEEQTKDWLSRLGDKCKSVIIHSEANPNGCLPAIKVDKNKGLTRSDLANAAFLFHRKLTVV